MNYIKKLEREVELQKQALSTIREETTRFQAYLSGPKFQGVLNDYVRTHEIHSLLERIRTAADPD